MEEIKVGEYVRTKDGDLFILENIIDNEVIPRGIYLPYAVWKDDIVKHSPNIIDLIEEGDYVNGEKVLHINKCLYGGEKVIITELNHSIFDNMIDDIVTKEQFNQVKYEV